MLFISGTTAVAGTMTIQIINATGQVIRSKTLSVGSVFSLQLPMDEIPSGYYRLIMDDRQNNKVRILSSVSDHHPCQTGK